jgi:hypothetical protein
MAKVHIPSHIQNNSLFIRQLANCKSDQKRHRLLKNATTSQLLSLAEICLNVVAARFSLTPRQKRRLMPHADFIRQMARARTEKGARKLIVQKGSGSAGMFAALLTPILMEIARAIAGGGIKAEAKAH